MTFHYMLDTDTVSFALRGEGNVGEKILEHRPSELCMSAITMAELRYGATRRNSTKLHRLIDVLSSSIAVVPFDEASAAHFGSLGNELAAVGTPIGEFDVLIAAHAVTLGLVLVTNNIKHFRRVKSLNVENWL